MEILKMKLLLIIAALVLGGCEEIELKENEVKVRAETRASSGDLSRFENDEVICYIFRDFYKGGLSCYWKEKP